MTLRLKNCFKDALRFVLAVMLLAYSCDDSTPFLPPLNYLSNQSSVNRTGYKPRYLAYNNRSTNWCAARFTYTVVSNRLCHIEQSAQWSVPYAAGLIPSRTVNILSIFRASRLRASLPSRILFGWLYVFSFVPFPPFYVCAFL
jgi:hypothetical protein